MDVESHQLTVVRSGPRGEAAQALQGNSKWRTVALYLLICLGLSHLGYRLLPLGVGFAAAPWGFALYILWSLFRVRDFSMQPVVARAVTSRVQPIRGIPGLTRDRVVLHFEDTEGRSMRRFILLPGVFQAGWRGELERASELLRSYDWPVDR